MNIALIAHDKKKPEMMQLVVAYESVFEKHTLFGTGTTGKRIMEETNLHVHRFMSGPLGGDQQVGAKIASNEMDLVIFLRDPLTAQPHEQDVMALMRLCDVHRIPLVTNLGGAEIVVKALQLNLMEWRNRK